MSKRPVHTSKSRTYVAMCNNINFDGFYFKKFTIPDNIKYCTLKYLQRNDTEFAAWYFLNMLNYEACLEAVMTFEDYQKLTDQPQIICKNCPGKR